MIRIDKFYSLLSISAPKLFAFVKNKPFIQFAFLNFFTIFFDCPNNHFPQIYHSKLHRVFWWYKYHAITILWESLICSLQENKRAMEE